MLSATVTRCSADTTAIPSVTPSPLRFPSLPHRVRFRALSGNFSAYPVYGRSESLSEGDGEAAEGDADPMGSSDVHISRMDALNPDYRSPRGFNGLPKAGRELLVDGTVLLYHLSRSQNFRECLWTVTLPSRFEDGTPFGTDDYKRFLRGWADFIRWVMEELGRDLARQELPNRWLYVIEPQEDRWRRDGVLAPHLHAVIPNRWLPNKRNPEKDKGFENSGYWALTTEDLDDIIHRCAARVMGKPVDCRSAGNVDAMHNLGKVGQYISKFNKIGQYFSKGSAIMGELQQSQWSNYIPANWYGSDKETRRQVRASVETYELGEGSLAQIAIALDELNTQHEAQTGKPLYANLHTHWVNPDGTTVPHGEPPPDDAFPVALTGRVNHLSDIDIGAGLLQALELHRVAVPIETPDDS